MGSVRTFPMQVRAECGVFLKAGTFRRSIDWQRVGRNCRRARTPAPSLSFLSPASTNTPLLSKAAITILSGLICEHFTRTPLLEWRDCRRTTALITSPVALSTVSTPPVATRCHVCVPPTHPRLCRTSQFSIPVLSSSLSLSPFPFFPFLYYYYYHGLCQASNKEV